MAGQAGFISLHFLSIAPGRRFSRPRQEERKREKNMNNQRKSNVLLLVTSAICLALCMVLPFLTGQIQQIGNMLCPMHIPVLLCGFLCGPAYAAAVGAVAPLLRFMLFGMPKLFPTGVAMCAELAAYGFLAGALSARLPKRPASVYIALIGAMIGGRIFWGVVMALLMGASGGAFTLSAFVAGAFINAVPGIILHIVLIPVIVLALERAVPFMKK